MPWCTTPLRAERSPVTPPAGHPIISPSGIPSAVMVFRILHPNLTSTLWTPVPSLASLSPGWPCSGGTSSPPCFACCSPMRRTTSVSQHVIVLGCYDSAVACPRSRARAERPFVAVSAPSAIDEHGDSPASYRRRRCRTRRRPWPRRWDARSGRRVTPPGKRLEPAARELAGDHVTGCSSTARCSLR